MIWPGEGVKKPQNKLARAQTFLLPLLLSCPCPSPNSQLGLGQSWVKVQCISSKWSRVIWPGERQRSRRTSWQESRPFCCPYSLAHHPTVIWCSGKARQKSNVFLANDPRWFDQEKGQRSRREQAGKNPDLFVAPSTLLSITHRSTSAQAIIQTFLLPRFCAVHQSMLFWLFWIVLSAKELQRTSLQESKTFCYLSPTSQLNLNYF